MTNATHTEIYCTRCYESPPSVAWSAQWNSYLCMYCWRVVEMYGVVP